MDEVGGAGKNGGKVVAQGTPTNLIQNVDARNAYFGESFKIS